MLKDVETWTWALDLHTQQACLIPAPLAFPPLLHGELRAEDMRGVGSGMSWAEAICQALFDWCTFLAIERVRDTQQRYPEVDLTTIPMTSEGAHLHHLLQIVGEQVTVYDVTGILPVPTCAICVGKSVIAYSTHCDIAQALSTGLRQAMQQYQSRQAQQPEYAVVPTPDLPGQVQAGRDHSGNRKDHHNPLQSPQSLDAHTDGQRQTIPEAWPARQEWLQQTLQAHGFHACALPLDHDPALMQVFPYVVRVLLARI
jgi:ribosomal protein S12 methylthiotransferase accessory factor YcaO